MNWLQLVATVCGLNGTPELAQEIDAASKKYDIENTIVLAVVYTESRCDPNAKGLSNDSGLMQVVPKYHQDKIREMNITNIFDVRQNLELGTRILKESGYNKNKSDALAIYNSGRADNERGKKYAKIVLERKVRYDILLND